MLYPCQRCGDPIATPTARCNWCNYRNARGRVATAAPATARDRRIGGFIIGAICLLIIGAIASIGNQYMDAKPNDHELSCQFLRNSEADFSGSDAPTNAKDAAELASIRSQMQLEHC